MRILKRYKDVNGNTVGYDVLSDGVTNRVSLEKALGLQEFIDNAFITSGGEYRAKSGYKIDTEVLYNNVLLPRVITKPQQSKTNETESEYHGKEFINICRKLRQYALENNFTVDMNKHSSNNDNNVHLFKLIEACDVTVHDFVRDYLYNLQPYSLSKFQGTS